jgi:protein FRA10AC1
MVEKYHEHLYKEFALADFSRGPGKVGLRWRTKQEVVDGRGERTCGNKHCPGISNTAATIDPTTTTTTTTSTDTNKNNTGEVNRMCSNLETFEVPFAYVEHGMRKKELVKLRLCLGCKHLILSSVASPSFEDSISKGNKMDHCKTIPSAKDIKSDCDSNSSLSSKSSSNQRRIIKSMKERKRKHRRRDHHRHKKERRQREEE